MVVILQQLVTMTCSSKLVCNITVECPELQIWLLLQYGQCLFINNQWHIKSADCQVITAPIINDGVMQQRMHQYLVICSKHVSVFRFCTDVGQFLKALNTDRLHVSL